MNSIEAEKIRGRDPTYQFPHVHDRGDALVDVPDLGLGEVQDVEGLVGELEVLVVVDGGHRGLALADKVVVIHVVGQVALALQRRHRLLHHLVEDVVRPLRLLPGKQFQTRWRVKLGALHK